MLNFLENVRKLGMATVVGRWRDRRLTNGRFLAQVQTRKGNWNVLIVGFLGLILLLSSCLRNSPPEIPIIEEPAADEPLFRPSFWKRPHCLPLVDGGRRR